MKVKAESFHLNGHIIGFCPQTKKLESPYKTPSNTLTVKGLKGISWFCGKQQVWCVFSVFCVTPFCDCTRPQHQETFQLKMALSQIPQYNDLKMKKHFRNLRFVLCSQTDVFQLGASNLWIIIVGFGR